MSKERVHRGVELLNLPKIKDDRGNLTFIEEIEQCPFKIERVYWLYDIPTNESRDGHAYKELEEIIIALSGSFQVEVHEINGERKIFNLNSSSQALCIPQLTWRQLRSFSTNSVVLILASLPYSEDDYIYDFNEFIQRRNSD